MRRPPASARSRMSPMRSLPARRGQSAPRQGARAIDERRTVEQRDPPDAVDRLHGLVLREPTDRRPGIGAAEVVDEMVRGSPTSHRAAVESDPSHSRAPGSIAPAWSIRSTGVPPAGPAATPSPSLILTTAGDHAPGIEHGGGRRRRVVSTAHTSVVPGHVGPGQPVQERVVVEPRGLVVEPLGGRQQRSRSPVARSSTASAQTGCPATRVDHLLVGDAACRRGRSTGTRRPRAREVSVRSRQRAADQPRLAGRLRRGGGVEGRRRRRT